VSSYQERLEEFAWGRRFTRLNRPVKNREGAWCDACGSSQPQILYGLADDASGRHVFVGQRCLQALTEQDVISRKSTRAPIEQAYQEELARRREEGDGLDRGSDVGSQAVLPPPSTPSQATAAPSPPAMAFIMVLQRGRWTETIQALLPEHGVWLVVPLPERLPSSAPDGGLRGMANHAAAEQAGGGVDGSAVGDRRATMPSMRTWSAFWEAARTFGLTASQMVQATGARFLSAWLDPHPDHRPDGMRAFVRERLFHVGDSSTHIA